MSSRISFLALLVLFGPSTLLAQERVAIVVQAGVLASESFGHPQLAVPSAAPAGAPRGSVRTIREGSNGPAMSVGVVIPYVRELTLEATYTFATFESKAFRVDESTGEKLDAREDEDHRVHAYGAGLRYVVPLDAAVRPHVSIGVGGITFRTTAGESPDPDPESSTWLMAVFGAGGTMTIRSNVTLRIDVRDFFYSCEDHSAPCETADTHHHLGLAGGVEIGL